MAATISPANSNEHLPEKQAFATKPCISMVTIVALIALGLVITGILTLMASLSGDLSGLGALSRLGWPVGTALLVAGVVSLVALSVVLCLRNKKVQKEEDSTHASKHAAKSLHEQPIQKNKQEVNVQENKRSVDDFLDQKKMLEAKTDVEFMMMTFDEIEALDRACRNIICARLVSTENLHVVPPPKNSLAELHAMGIDQIMASVPNEKLVFVSSIQVAMLLAKRKTMPESYLKALFPVNEYTYYKLSDSDVALNLKPHLKMLSLEIFRLLPLNTFKEASFPWERIATQEDFDALFSLSASKASWLKEYDNEFTQKVISSLKMGPLKKLILFMNLDYLGIFSEQQIQDAQFPWEHFIEQPGFGHRIRVIPSSVFIKAEFPFKELIKHPGELKDFFDISMVSSNGQERNDVYTRAILESLGQDIIKEIAPYLTPDHLPFFLQADLIDEHFPWLPFMQQKGFGYKIADIPTDILVLSHLPWDELTKHPDEFKKALDTQRYRSSGQPWRHEFTETILQSMGTGMLNKIVDHLTPEHFPLFALKQYSFHNFPLVPFIEKKGIGKVLHNSKELSLDIFSLLVFPWPQLMNNKSEFDELLPSDYNTSRTSAILAKIPDVNVQYLFDWKALNKKHHQLLSPDRQAKIRIT